MLNDAYRAGQAAAFARFGVKEAGVKEASVGESLLNAGKWTGQKLLSAGKTVGHGLIGHPLKAYEQLRAGTITKPGGLWHETWWPTMPADGRWLSKVGPAIQRAQTLYTGYDLLNQLTGRSGDPNEDRLTNTLSSLGGTVGMNYGFPALGVIGGGLAATAGHFGGKALGHALHHTATQRPQYREERPLPTELSYLRAPGYPYGPYPAE